MSSAEHGQVKLGEITANAMVEVLDLAVPGSARREDVRLLTHDSALDGIEGPVLACSAEFTDAGKSGHLLLLGLAAARGLAAALRDEPAPEPDETVAEISEPDHAVIAELAGRLLASAAAAVGGVLGSELEFAPPAIALCATTEAIAALPALNGRAPQLVRSALRICDEPAWIVQHVPSAFAVRLSAASEEQEAESLDVDGPSAEGPVPALSDVSMRVWAELGRTQMPAAVVASLPSGAVVELDRRPDEPVDVYVNGRRFAVGELVVDGAEWAIRIDAILAAQDAQALSVDDTPWPASS